MENKIINFGDEKRKITITRKMGFEHGYSTLTYYLNKIEFIHGFVILYFDNGYTEIVNSNSIRDIKIYERNNNNV